MSRLRRLARWSAIVIASMLLVVAAAVVVIETEWFKNWLRLRLVQGVTAMLEGELRVGRLAGSLWTGVMLDNVEVWDRHGQVFKADHIRVRYDPFQLVRRRWIVDRVVIENAAIQVADTPTGWNVLQLAKRRERTGPPPTVVIRDIDLSDATVTITNGNSEARTLSAVELDAALTISEGEVDLNVASLHAYDKTTGLTVRELSGTADDNFRTFGLTFSADAPGTALSGVVRGETTDAGRVLTGTVDATHADLARLTGRRQMASDITGHITVNARIPGGDRPADLRFTFTGPRSTAFGYTADRIDARGRWVRDTVTFDARVTGYGAQATVDGVWRNPGRPNTTFTGRGAFTSVDVRRLPARLNLPQLDTRLSGRYEAVVGPDRWHAKTTLAGGQIEGMTVEAGTVASVDAAGGVTSYTADGTARHVNLQRMGKAIPVPALDAPRFDSDLSGRFTVRGQHRKDAPPQITGTAVLVGSTISGTTLPAMQADVSLANRRLEVTADATFEGLNQTTLGVPMEIAATGKAKGWFVIPDLDQPLTEDNIEGKARVDLGPSVIRGTPIVSGIVDAELTKGVATLYEVDVQHDGASIKAKGAIGVHEPVDGAGVVVAAEIRDRAFLEKMLQRPILTVGTVDATITGTVDSPSATGTLTLRETAYEDKVNALTSTTRFSVDWPERDASRLEWKVDTNATFVTLAGNELQRMTVTAVGGMREMAIEAMAEQKNRSLGIEGRLSIRPAAQELLLRRFALTTADIAWSLPAGRQATVKYGADRVEVSDLALVREAQQILISGGFDLQPPAAGVAPASLTLDVQNVQVADVNRALLGTRQLTGLVNGTVTVTGTREAPVVEGDLTIRDGVVQGVPYASVTAKGRYVNRLATFDAVLDQAPGASLRAVGTVPVGAGVTPGDSMDVRVTGGPISLALAQAFTTEIDKVTGTAAIDLRVTGTFRDPIVNGTAAVTNGAFDVSATGVRYHTVDALLAFAESQMTIERLQMLDPDGTMLTATGGLDVHRGIAKRAVDVQVRANGFSVLDNQFGNATMDVDVRVSGEIAAPVVRGTARLDSGRLEVAEILSRTTAKPYATEAQAGIGETPAKPAVPAVSPFQNADLQLQIRLPDNLVLRGRGLRVANRGFGIGDMNIVTGGSFDVTKPPNQPLDVRGSLEVVRGTYTFQGRRFEIERGSEVRFGGGTLKDPALNVNATREVSGVTAEVRLRGSVQSPELTLASRPPLDEGDILSLIVFNQPVNALGAAQQVDLGERAAQIAASAIASPLADSIGRALNLDLFEIQAPTSDDGTGSVTIGSQLGSRLLVGLKQQFGHSEASLLTLEYRVSRLLRFVTSIASGTLQAHATRRTDRGGVDLIFVIRY